jgi:endoglucanase
MPTAPADGCSPGRSASTSCGRSPPGRPRLARLRASGIDRADGFALNVSSFIGTPRGVAAGAQLSRRLGGKHFVIDTSRNGAGTAGGWWTDYALSLARRVR